MGDAAQDRRAGGPVDDRGSATADICEAAVTRVFVNVSVAVAAHDDGQGPRVDGKELTVSSLSWQAVGKHNGQGNVVGPSGSVARAGDDAIMHTDDHDLDHDYDDYGDGDCGDSDGGGLALGSSGGGAPVKSATFVVDRHWRTKQQVHAVAGVHADGGKDKMALARTVASVRNR